MGQIRWKSGFLRVWMVLSALWVVPFSVLMFHDLGPMFLFHWADGHLPVVVGIFGPPIFFLVIGMVIGWISRGFKSNKSNWWWKGLTGTVFCLESGWSWVRYGSFVIFVAKDEGDVGEELLSYIELAFGPPIFFRVIGMVIDWISRGYKSNKSN